jgi:methylthioribose-1-phosphate isomerase
MSEPDGRGQKLRVRTVEILPDEVVLIDQLALPQEERYVRCHTWQEVAARITDMTVRGAPAIGVAAAGALALAGRTAAAKLSPRFVPDLEDAAAGLLATRPTAVNLSWAIGQMRAVWDELGDEPPTCAAALYARAVAIHDDDVHRCRAIGEHGAALFKPGDTILTHCNAGALATAGYGTALGVIRSAYTRHGTISVFVDETRPWLQGARLTAWELQVEGIPYCVIADNMAGYFLHRGEIQGVVTGADRIAANGDVANKIGTYSVAVLAAANDVPFYVAAPLSTVDLAVPHGGRIPIEERAEDEVLSFHGARVCPAGARARHPAFDVTPARYVSGIITEAGVLRPPYHEALAVAVAASRPFGAAAATLPAPVLTDPETPS